MQKRVVEPQADEARTESKVARAEPSRGAPDAAHTPGPWRVGGRWKETHCAGTIVAPESGKTAALPLTIAYVGPNIRTKSAGHVAIMQANARLIAQAPTLLAENEKLKSGHVVLLEALKRLTAKLNLMHKDQDYIGIFQFAMLHGMTYDGPNYETELREAEAAIEQAERP